MNIPPRRLFDCLSDVVKQDHANFLNYKKDGIWVQYSAKQVVDLINKISLALWQLGLSSRETNEYEISKIAIMANNMPEWLIVDLAIQQIGAISIPLFVNSSNKELELILNEAKVALIFVGNDDQFQKVNNIKSNVPSLKYIFSFDGKQQPTLSALIQNIPDDYKKHITEIEKIKESIDPDRVVTILYTSGTTGAPKGVMLTHKNIYMNMMMNQALLDFPIDPSYRALSFLPLNHIFERGATYIYLFHRYKIYYPDSIHNITTCMAEIKPHIFAVVPRLLEKIYQAVLTKGEDLSGVKRLLFKWSLKQSKSFEYFTPQSFLYKIKLRLAWYILYSKVNHILGGENKSVWMAGAQCSGDIIRFFGAANIDIREGYGLTENSPVISCNSKKYGSKIGTVGHVLPGQEIKVADDGELWVKGPSVMKGYYNHIKLTSEFIQDGWLKTGDMVSIDHNNLITIVGRKKEIYKTSGGKFFSPATIETHFNEFAVINQICVIGENRKFVSALVIPEFEYLKTLITTGKIIYTGDSSMEPKNLIKDPAVIAYLTNLIVGDTHFNKIEQIKKVILLADVWGPDSGELTPKLSLKRKFIDQKYKAIIDSIYDV
ncbi:MAG: long-chain fatty acid--CoA ligase [Phycisphaerales bacterium]|nr:long-chain fatty acid--CoA ligase [Phycisphaerales bacterium]